MHPALTERCHYSHNHSYRSRLRCMSRRRSLAVLGRYSCITKSKHPSPLLVCFTTVGAPVSPHPVRREQTASLSSSARPLLPVPHQARNAQADARFAGHQQHTRAHTHTANKVKTWLLQYTSPPQLLRRYTSVQTATLPSRQRPCRRPSPYSRPAAPRAAGVGLASGGGQDMHDGPGIIYIGIPAQG